jgi:tight adherence protein C
MLIFLVILILLAGTAALVFWNFLFFIARSSDEEEMAHYTYRALQDKIRKLAEKYKTDTAALEKRSGLSKEFRKLFNDPKSSEKQAEKLQKKIDKLDGGDFSGINIFVLPGYGFLKFFKITADSKMFSKLMETFSELKGREFAAQNTRYLLSAVMSGAIGGVGASIILGVLLMAATGDSSMALLIGVGGTMMSVVGAMAAYSDVGAKLKKRRAEIMSDFPQVVSELALLTSSGMEILPAWAKVAGERSGVLYGEMRQTAQEILENGVNPSAALEMFIRRCGTKETARLGTSILQNLERGNAELSNFLIGLSAEAWEERKHSARRMGASAQSKLLIPIMMIFIGILILVIVPAMTGMGDMGF